MTDSATFTTPEASREDLSDLLLDVLPPDRTTLGNLSARKALSREAGREIQKDEYERIRERAFDLGLITKGGGRGGSIALEEGIEGGSRYEAPTAPTAGRGGGSRAKKEAPAKDFKAVLWASADKLRAQMDAAEYKHLVLGLIFLKYISDAFAEHRVRVLATVSNPESDYYLGDDPAEPGLIKSQAELSA